MHQSDDTDLSEEALIERFPFQPNPFDANAPFDFGNGGAMFETYGLELNYVLAQPRNRIWTLVEVDGHLYVVSGFHVVNRLGYFVSAMPCDGNVSYCVDLEAEMIEEGGP